MTITEFVEISGEIIKFYGKELAEYESKIWYEELKDMSKERFRQITRECFRNNKFMPKLADIVEYNRTVPRIEKQQETTTEDCKICQNTGLLGYYKRDVENGINYFYAAKCKCSNGMKLGKTIPTIDEVKILV